MANNQSATTSITVDYYGVGYHLGIASVLEGRDADEQSFFYDGLNKCNPQGRYTNLIEVDKSALVRGYSDGARHQCYEEYRKSGLSIEVHDLKPESYRCKYGINGSKTW